MLETERRTRTLTDHDIKAIVEGVADMYECRPCPLDLKQAAAALVFYDNLNGWFEGTKRTIWNTILVAFVLGVIGLLSLGYWGKMGK